MTHQERTEYDRITKEQRDLRAKEQRKDLWKGIRFTDPLTEEIVRTRSSSYQDKGPFAGVLKSFYEREDGLVPEKDQTQAPAPSFPKAPSAMTIPFKPKRRRRRRKTLRTLASLRSM